MTWRQLNLLENLTAPVPTFTVAKEDPVILLNKGEGELFAGKINKVMKLKLFYLLIIAYLFMNELEREYLSFMKDSIYLSRERATTFSNEC